VNLLEKKVGRKKMRLPWRKGQTIWSFGRKLFSDHKGASIEIERKGEGIVEEVSIKCG